MISGVSEDLKPVVWVGSCLEDLNQFPAEVQDVMGKQPEFTLGSGNVFADLDYPDPEATLLKARLAREISAAIRQKEITQAAAGEILGLDQPKVSAPLRGRLAGFSIERLLRCLTALERDVTITVGPKKRERGQVELILVPRSRTEPAPAALVATLASRMGS